METNVTLADIFDLRSLQSLLDDFLTLTGFNTYIEDHEGKPLVATGSQAVCAFYSAHADLQGLCSHTTRRQAEGVLAGEFKLFKCRDNLWNMVTPIIVGEHHFGNLSLGQFFFSDEQVDEAGYRKYAEKHGFPQEEYLAALSSVPRYDRQRVFLAMNFFVKLAATISQLGYRNLVLTKALGEQQVILDSLRETHRFTQSIINGTQEGIIVYDLDLRYQFWNPYMEKLTGIPESQALGKHPLEVFPYMHDTGRIEMLEKALKGESSTSEFPFSNPWKGESGWNLGTADPLRNASGEIVGVIGTLRDITGKKETEERVRFLSFHDPLTGLYNRRFYEEELRRLNTERNLPISIVMGDVNGLKLINDAFGHEQGDLLLKKASDAIKQACRGDDVVARWGGDEFVILLPRTDNAAAERIVDRIRENYRGQQVSSIEVSISFGWGTKTDSTQDIMKILKSAEDHMYSNKTLESAGVRSNLIRTIINTLHEKSSREEQHSKRVSELCPLIGLAMGLPEADIARLRFAGLLHDIGKIAIPDHILNKPGRLSESEYEEIKRHPEIGYRILISAQEMVGLADFILAHHERWDGTGYPKGLKGKSIPLLARIVAAADAYDAMTRQRTYRKVLTTNEAVAELKKHAGTQFDPDVVKALTEQILA